MSVVPFFIAANDNYKVPIPTDLDIAGHVMGELDNLMISDDQQIEGLFLAMINVASRSAMGPANQPTTHDDLDRYNQLNHLSGVLEIYLNTIMKHFCDRLVRFGMAEADDGA